jgi:hypothetical protein
MAEHNLNKTLTDMESNAEDELSFLFSTGAEYFTTAQLIRLKGQWEVKNYYFHRLHKTWIRMAALAPVWLCVWLLFDLVGLPVLGLIFLFFFPFSLVSFFVGMFLMRWLFPGKGHLDMVGDMIQEELIKRKAKEKRKS